MTKKYAVTLGAVLAVSGLLSAGVRAQFGGNQQPPYTPAKDAKDLRAVLFNWTWYTGMLRGIDEHELMVSLEYQANAGSVQVDGQPCAPTTIPQRPVQRRSVMIRGFVSVT